SALLMCLFGGLVRNIYPLNKLGMGLSLNAMTVGLMSVAGPSLGAFILEWASWHWIFLITIPLCLVAYFGIRYLPDIPRNGGRFDWPACALIIPVFGLSIVGLDILVERPFNALFCLV